MMTMLIEPVYLYGLITANFLLIFLLAALVKLKKDARLAEAQEILKQAIKQAGQIEKTAAINQEKLSQWLEKRVRKASETILERYQQSLNLNINKSIEILEKTSKEVEKQALKEVGLAVENYKKARLEKAQEEIAVIINQITADVLGRSLSVNDHEQLIFSALEKARQRLKI